MNSACFIYQSTLQYSMEKKPCKQMSALKCYWGCGINTCEIQHEDIQGTSVLEGNELGISSLKDGLAAQLVWSSG